MSSLSLPCERRYGKRWNGKEIQSKCLLYIWNSIEIYGVLANRIYFEAFNKMYQNKLNDFIFYNREHILLHTFRLCPSTCICNQFITTIAYSWGDCYYSLEFLGLLFGGKNETLNEDLLWVLGGCGLMFAWHLLFGQWKWHLLFSRSDINCRFYTIAMVWKKRLRIIFNYTLTAHLVNVFILQFLFLYGITI